MGGDGRLSASEGDQHKDVMEGGQKLASFYVRLTMKDVVEGHLGKARNTVK